jgi:hypothetical protein
MQFFSWQYWFMALAINLFITLTWLNINYKNTKIIPNTI